MKSNNRFQSCAHLFGLLCIFAGVLIARDPINAAPADTAPAPTASEKIDFERARELIQKEKAGKQLTPEEKAYVDCARQERQGKSGPQRSRATGETAVKNTAAQTPLTEMTAKDRHKGEDGGLYGGGRNDPPETHQAEAKKELAQVVPRDAAGKPAKDGKIVLLAIGMSNTTQEFSAFKEAADADPMKSPQMVLVDGAQGSQGAEEWASTGTERIWSVVDQRLKQAGVTHAQVQVVWLKQAVKNPKPGDAMQNARALEGYIKTILNHAEATFPNLRVAWLSSRTYGGYSAVHPEPESFETAFSVRWVIQEQIKKVPELNYDPAKGKVKSPLLLWGPYLWTDGLTPRKSDGLVWRHEDVRSDGTHPSEEGRKKVVGLLMNFFKTDPNTKTWFVKPN